MSALNFGILVTLLLAVTIDLAGCLQCFSCKGSIETCLPVAEPVECSYGQPYCILTRNESGRTLQGCNSNRSNCLIVVEFNPDPYLPVDQMCCMTDGCNCVGDQCYLDEAQEQEAASQLPPKIEHVPVFEVLKQIDEIILKTTTPATRTSTIRTTKARTSTRVVVQTVTKTVTRPTIMTTRKMEPAITTTLKTTTEKSKVRKFPISQPLAVGQLVEVGRRRTTKATTPRVTTAASTPKQLELAPFLVPIERVSPSPLPASIFQSSKIEAESGPRLGPIFDRPFEKEDVEMQQIPARLLVAETFSPVTVTAKVPATAVPTNAVPPTTKAPTVVPAMKTSTMRTLGPKTVKAGKSTSRPIFTSTKPTTTLKLTTTALMEPFELPAVTSRTEPSLAIDEAADRAAVVPLVRPILAEPSYERSSVMPSVPPAFKALMLKDFERPINPLAAN